MYADFTCIIAPSQSAMFKLLKICTELTNDNTICFTGANLSICVLTQSSVEFAHTRYVFKWRGSDYCWQKNTLVSLLL